MGFFKNLFEKKVCDICGEEIGLLGNRKLENGNCCKDCARKLSPWFTERKHSTVEEIKEQLADREENRKAVSVFHCSRSFGEGMKVLVDENTCKFMVTRERNWQESNPDVLDFSQVTACNLDLKESKKEVYRKMKDSEGNIRNESYAPRRYEHSYDFLMTIRVSHPYIDEIEFSLSDGSFQVEGRENEGLASMFFEGKLTPEGSVYPPTTEERRCHPKYARCEKWAYELKELLMYTEKKPSDRIERLIEKYEMYEQRANKAFKNKDNAGYSRAQRCKIQAIQALEEAYSEDPSSAAADRIREIQRKFQNDPKPQVEKTSVTKFCPQCGSPLSGGAYCTNCGACVR